MRGSLSSAVSLSCLFSGATSFNQQLGGSWSQSTADMEGMFGQCPGGSVVGKTNTANGTPV